MNSSIQIKCSTLIAMLLEKKKLRIREPIFACPHSYFAGKPIQSGISSSSIIGEAGLLYRVWGFVFVSPDQPLRVSRVHTSYYSEDAALHKLRAELESLRA